ncbi:MAG TPA: glycosyltransferase family 2 protein [Stellaceae bacterium]|nr:glycosyltransferase family 2 protein [Stellaceae bacterium]
MRASVQTQIEPEPPRGIRLDLPASPAAPASSRRAAAELCVVIPTLNERDNIGPMIERLDAALAGIEWEAIFVDDDSDDGTAERIRAAAAADRRIRGIQRIGRRGLSSACIEGALASAAPFIAVIDADLQHDETLLPTMLAALKAEPLDVVVGSRYAAGGGIEAWSGGRAEVSRVATRLSRLVLKADIADPMSGFFMIRRDAFDGAVRRLSAVGFKILLDLFASSPRPLRFKELPYRFRPRAHGTSKLDTLVAWEYLMLIADKLIGHIVPVRFALFAAVGGVGLLVHLATLWSGLRLAGLDFTAAQAVATVVAMIGNFALNNVFTYRDRRLRGLAFLRGLLTFSAVCGLGAIANVGVASVLFGNRRAWWVAGIAGAVVGSVWNYAVTSVVTWQKGR